MLPFTFKHYQVRQCLGEGGFGQVFEAWDEKLCRSVAIKRLKPIAGLPPSEHLLKEARLAASLQHAAFVKIHALEEDQDSQSIVMELVPGHTLKFLLQQAPLTLAQTLDIVQQIAQAMQEAHASGLVHGDLKPANLMLEPSGKVRILDFGLAAHQDIAATVSLLQVDPQGTIAYMAPELLQGAPASIASDIYALGVLLYELLHRKRPFAELSGLALAAMLMQTNSSQWPFDASLKPGLPQLIQAMTASPPSARMRSMQQVLAALPTSLLPASPPLRLPHLLRRRALWRWAAVALFTVGAVLVVWHASEKHILQTWLAAWRPFSYSENLQTGLLALKSYDIPGNLENAEQAFQAILERQPQHAAAAAGISLSFSLRYQSDQHDPTWLQKATAAAQQAMQLNEQLALSQIAHSKVLDLQGKHDAALASLERALLLDPDNVFAWMQKVDVLLHLRRQEAAMQWAERGRQHFPQERFFADSMGQIWYAQGKYKQAEQAFRQSLQLQADAIFAYANLSAVLQRQNRFDEALQVLQQGLQIRPSNWLYGNLGNALFMRGDYVGAAKAFESAVSVKQGNPRDYLGWANLADTLLLLPGQTEKATQAYQKARQLLTPWLANKPQDVTLISRMGLYAARTGDKTMALECMQKINATASKQPDLQFRMALVYELIGQRDLALQHLLKAKQMGLPEKYIEAEPAFVHLRRDQRYSTS